MVLQSQTPASLLAHSCGVDRDRGVIRIRAYFDVVPDEGDVEDIQGVETEICAQLDDWVTEIEIEVLAPGKQPSLLPGVVYRRGPGPLPPCWRDRQKG